MDTRIVKRILCSLAILVGILGIGSPTLANDLPTAAGSPIAGINFDDRPLMLPVQRNFQMAMLTASSELGRSCGRMEAYGWRMDNSEQDRVNQIFNNTVDRMRAQGYVVEAKAPSSVSRDVTLFTADRTDRHLIFLWSAGEIGLVMVLCETSAPLPPVGQNYAQPEPATMPSHMPMAKTAQVAAPRAAGAPVRLTVAGRQVHENFSPIGKWIGNYTCAQGTTGATLHIERIKGDQFEGTFSFYPTSKNPYVPKGSYVVFGEYDSDSQRILVNPGKWIERPKDYYNTIMIGSFDPVGRTYSGYFQGITGCTSFEANLDAGSASRAVAEKETSASKAKANAPKAPKKAKKAVKKKADSAQTTAPMAEAPTKKAAKKAEKQTQSQMIDGLEVATPEPTTKEASPMKGDLSIIGEPAKIPGGSSRNSSMDPPAGILIGPGKK